MRVMAQMAMVMNLDKCIGCHTCSVTCKQAWTNRTGVEYAEVDIEQDPDGAELVEHANSGNRTVPTLLFDDGSTLTNPSAREVQRHLEALAS